MGNTIARSLSKKVGRRMAVPLGTLLNQKTAPVISLLSSGTITDVSAIVAATIDNGYADTVWSVEYGMTTAYGYTATGGTITELTAITKSLTSLFKYQAYNWRIKAVNSEGTTYSDDQAFTTLEPAAVRSANTVAWFKSDDLTTITKDGSNLVSRWNDKLGSGHDLIQATGTKQPVWSADGVLFDGSSDVMKTAGFVLAQPTFIFSFLKQVTWTANDYLFDGDSSNTGAIYQSAVTPGIRGFAGSNSAPNANLAVDVFGIVRLKFNGAASKIQVNETTAITGNFGAGNMGGFTLASYGAANASFANAQFKEIILNNSDLSASDELDIYFYLKKKYGFVTITLLGDSTVSAYLTYVSVSSLMDNDNYVPTSLAASGHTIAQQKTAWQALTAQKRAHMNCVFVQIGLNDLTMTTAAIIAAYQDLIDTIRTDIGTANKIVGVTMIPGYLHTDQQWIDLNEAIRGNGATPITKLDGFIDTVATALNDGSNGLAAAYNTGDDLHENDAGRQIIADLYDLKLTELGL
jgi:lysophospholipase L1-like esterase